MIVRGSSKVAALATEASNPVRRSPEVNGVARCALRAWQIGRWAAVAVLLPLVTVLHAAVIVVLAHPFDPADLVATSEPLALVDVRGEPLATLPAQGADRL